MKFDDSLFGKSAIIDWNQYKNTCIDSFVLDEKSQLQKLEKVLAKIKSMDKDSLIYASTYPIEQNESGIRMYSDMLWIKTKLSCEQLEDLFIKYREIEPSSIFDLNDEERNSVDLFINNDFQHSDFINLSDSFKSDEIKLIHWD